MRLAERREEARVEHDVDPGDDRDIAGAVAQMATGRIQCNEGGRTGRINAEARAIQVEVVGQSIGNDAQGRPGPGLDVTCPGAHALEMVVVGVGEANEHTGASLPKHRQRHAGVLRGFVGDGQQQALLRVHRFGFARH